MEIKRQRLIHLHGTKHLDNPTLLGLGEIAVRHAATKNETELAVKTVIKDENDADKDVVVYFPSLSKVTTVVEAETSAREAAIKTLGDRLTEVEEFMGDGESLTDVLEGLQDALEGQIEAETSAREAAINGLTTAYQAADAALETAYKAADEALEGKITELGTTVSDIETAYKAADEALEGKITELGTTLRGEFAAADAALETAYKAADTELDGKITALGTTVSDIETAYKAADEALDGKITELGTTLRGEFAAADTELETAYKAADADLMSALNDHKVAKYSSGEGDDVIEGNIHLDAGERERWNLAASNIEGFLSETNTEAALDSLKELQTWIETHGSSAENLATGVTANTNAIKELKDADEALDGKITELGTTLRGEFAEADEALDGKITALDTAYKAADEALDGKITALETAYKAADTELDGKITALDTAYKAADEALDGKITELGTTLRGEFAAADTALDGKITALDTAYKAADTELDGKITALSTTVSNLDTAYKAADTALEGKITALGTTLREEFAAADTELETAYKAADADLMSAMVTSAEVVMSSDKIINATFNSNKLTFDFTDFVIDCGSYDEQITDKE
jgi:uncharacterized protein YecT (DUF1311 family)